ncbi:DUF1877 family protein [Streptomyces chartreusis]|uniref:DUF1877 family protein n=1 Tax=Streptomyces chartreusis TaxID=1969 RepID=UPI002E81D310|nr:DUF1877 family protein [Streptomyces chartreusis]WUB16485.1 YfbM family protein [Streptomyces chartreusis]
MALTQQFARITPEYLERCRASAADSAGAAPDWDPPPEDRLDTDWAIWGLIRYLRATAAGGDLITLLDRAVSGDPGGDVDFLDHVEVYDGFDGPPRLLAAAAVADIARALASVDLQGVLADLPPTTEEAAACGFGRGFNGDVRAYLVHHFTAMREFYDGAARHGHCVIVWTD